MFLQLFKKFYQTGGNATVRERERLNIDYLQTDNLLDHIKILIEPDTLPHGRVSAFVVLRKSAIEIKSKNPGEIL